MNAINQIKSKYSNLAKSAKASLWFVGCYVIQRGLQFIGMPIYTRIMSTEEYGVYSVFLSWFHLVTVFSSLSIYSGTFNKAMVKYENERDQYISSIQYLTLMVGMIFCGLIIVFHDAIFSLTGYTLKLQLLFCIHILLFPTLQYWSQKQRFLFEYKLLVFITLLNSFVSLGLGIFCVFVSEDKSFALIAVTVLVQAIINICIFVSLAYKGKCVYNKDYWKWSTTTAIPLIPHYLSEILLGHADRLMIDQMCGAAQAGIYNIVYQISMVMTIIRTGINSSYIPWLYYSLKQKKYEVIKNVTKLITILMCSLTILLILVGPEILKIVAAPSYYEAVVDIPAIMIGGFFIFVYLLFLNIEIYYEQNQYVAISSVIAATLNVVLNYVCINKWGYLAAGYTTMVSYLVMAILHYLFLMRIAKKNEEVKLLFDFRFLCCCSVVLLIVGLLCIKLYELLIVRYIIVAGICVVMYLKRNTILAMIKNMRKRNCE